MKTVGSARMVVQILFIQGGGSGVHDDWDSKLVEDLRRQLGERYEVRYPRMPDEAEPSHSKWTSAIRRELAVLRDGAILVGHSVGGTILIQALSERVPQFRLGAIVLVSAPFAGEGGWSVDKFELSPELGARLPRGVPVHVFHGQEDPIVPPSHAELYARAIPQAEVHSLPGRDHQLNNDLREIAAVIRRLAEVHEPGPC